MLTVIGTHHTNPHLIPQLIDHTHQRTPTAPIPGLPRLLLPGPPHPAISHAPITGFPLPQSLPQTPFQAPIQHINTQSRSMHTAYHHPNQFQNATGFNNSNIIPSYPLATTPFSESSTVFNTSSTPKSEKRVTPSPKTSKSLKHDENSLQNINATKKITNNSAQITREANNEFCVDATYDTGKNDVNESFENNVYCHQGNSCNHICRKSQLHNNDIDISCSCTAKITVSNECAFQNNSEFLDVTSITTHDEQHSPKDLDQMGSKQTPVYNISNSVTPELKQEPGFDDKTKRSDCNDVISATSKGKQFIKNTNSEDFESNKKRRMFGEEISGDIEINCKTINTKQRQENGVKRVKKLRHSIAAILDMNIFSGKEENDSANIDIDGDLGDASTLLNNPDGDTKGKVDGRGCKLSKDSYQMDTVNKSMTPDEYDSSNKLQHSYTVDNSNFGPEMKREENLPKSVQAVICNTTVHFQCFPDSVPDKENDNNDDESVNMNDPDFEEIEVDDDSADYNNGPDSNIDNISSHSLLSIQYKASTTIHSDDEVDAQSDSSSVGSFNKTADIHEREEDDLSHLKKLEDLVVKNQTDHFKRDEFFNAREQILQCSDFQLRETVGEKIDRKFDGATLTVNNGDRCCRLPECFPSDLKPDKNISCCSENSQTRSYLQNNTHSHTHLLQSSSKEQLHHQQQQKQHFDHTLEMSAPSHNAPPKQFKLQSNPNNTCQKDKMFQHEGDQNHRGSYNNLKQKQQQQSQETSPQRSDKSNKSAFKLITKSPLSIPQPQFNRLPFPPHTLDPTLLSPRQQATMNDAFHLNTISKAHHPNTQIDNSHKNNLLRFQPLLNDSQSQLDAISLLRDHTSIHLPPQTQLTMFNNTGMLPTILKNQSPSAMNTWLNLVHQQYYTNPILKSNIIAHGSLPSCSPVQSVASSKRMSHSNVAPRYHCESCSKTYSTFGGLSKHKQFHCLQHVKKDFGCKFCTKSYSSLGALKMHIRTHTLPCKCHVCGKAFSRPWLLQGHVRTHTGEKPFQCNQCGRSFADRSNLRAHLQTHAEIKKYACVKCGKTFSRMSLLNKHSDGSCPANVMTCL